MSAYLRVTHVNPLPGKPHVVLNDRIEAVDSETGEILADLSHTVWKWNTDAKIGEAFSVDVSFYSVALCIEETPEPAICPCRDVRYGKCERPAGHVGQHKHGSHWWDNAADLEPSPS